MKIKMMLAALALCAGGAAQADILTNGAFENGMTGWSYTGIINWAGGAPYFGGGSTAANGHGMAVFNAGDNGANGAVWQSFATIAGHSYGIEFDYGTNNGVVQAIDVLLTSQNNTQLGNIRYASAGPALPRHSLGFTAIDGLTTLTFRDVAANWTFSTDGLLDNVVVTDLTANNVPEPASLGLLGLGLAGLGLVRRRQR